MKAINSETHSCTVSLASFAILAEGGTEAFIILDTFAIYKTVSIMVGEPKGLDEYDSLVNSDPALDTPQLLDP